MGYCRLNSSCNELYSPRLYLYFYSLYKISFPIFLEYYTGLKKVFQGNHIGSVMISVLVSNAAVHGF